MNFNRFVYALAFIAVLSSPKAIAQTYELLSFGTQDGGEVEAAFFKADSNKVVVFAHGAIFDKESWYFLAEDFQRRGVSALSIDFRGYGNSTAGSTSKKMYDILGAVSYLQALGFTDINIVGASMGGAAVLVALNSGPVAIRKVVLLAPAGGPAITSMTSDKLFVVSENERMFNGVMAIYNASAEPKQIQIYPGRAHAQHLFKTGVRDALIERITNFIIPGKP